MNFKKVLLTIIGAIIILLIAYEGWNFFDPTPVVVVQNPTITPAKAPEPKEIKVDDGWKADHTSQGRWGKLNRWYVPEYPIITSTKWFTMKGYFTTGSIVEEHPCRIEYRSKTTGKTTAVFADTDKNLYFKEDPETGKYQEHPIPEDEFHAVQLDAESMRIVLIDNKTPRVMAYRASY